MQTAVIYARISRDRAGAGLGVERQQDDCQALAARLDWDVVRVFVDNDLSAYSGRNRPAYQEMLRLLEAGTVNGVLAWHTDRLHRSPRELEHYIAVAERHSVTTQTVQAGEIDLSTPSGRAVARTLGAWARYESEHKSERVTRAMQQATAAGKFTGGPVPFGWRIVDGVPELHPDEAAEVANATRAVLAGKSLGSVIRDMRGRGVQSRHGNPFNYSSLRRALLRARNAGLADWHGEIVGESTFPAIVSEDEWRAVTQLLADPSRRKSQSSRVRHLLAGIARCGTCGAPMKSATRRDTEGRQIVSYRCSTPQAGHPVRSAAPLEEYVSETVLAILSRPGTAEVFARKESGPDLGGLRADAIALRARLDGAAEQYADGEITGPQLAKITAVIQEKLTAVESRMTTGSSPVADLLAGGDARTVWEAADVETRRSVVDALMEVVLLATGKGHGKLFRPEAVRLVPKGAAR